MFLRKISSLTRKCSLQYFSAQANAEAESHVKEPQDAGTQQSLISPLEHPDFFHVHNMFTIKDLFDARFHYGHKIGSLHERMTPYIFGSRFDHLIIDLNTTSEHLRKALNFSAHIAYNDGLILFISRNPHFSILAEETALECKEFAHTRLWKPGTLTNSIVRFQTDIRLPDLCIFLSPLNEMRQEHPAVIEAAKMNIPSISIVDSDCDPTFITYPIPGNDDSWQSVHLYCRLVKEAILRGKERRKKDFPEKGKEQS